jgi:putative transposase
LQGSADRPVNLLGRCCRANFQVYGARKVWRQLKREGVPAARCTVERLMRHTGLAGVVRGKIVKTTISDKAAPCPLNKVNRKFTADKPHSPAGFVPDALDQALHQRRPVKGALIHHSDQGSQYVSIKYTERLADAGVEPSVGSVGNFYDKALAETINGLYKTELIRRRGPLRSIEAVEYATLKWVDWFNNSPLLEPIGNIPLAEAEARYYALINDRPMAA